MVLKEIIKNVKVVKSFLKILVGFKFMIGRLVGSVIWILCYVVRYFKKCEF